MQVQDQEICLRSIEAITRELYPREINTFEQFRDSINEYLNTATDNKGESQSNAASGFDYDQLKNSMEFVKLMIELVALIRGGVIIVDAVKKILAKRCSNLEKVNKILKMIFVEDKK